MSQIYDGYYPQQPMMNRSMYQVPVYQPPISPYQPQAQPMGLNNVVGRYINDGQEVTASEVPMNGSFAVFPKKDMSEIIVKSWQSNGTIATMSFKPVLSEKNTADNKNIEETEKIALSLTDALSSSIARRFDALEEKIDALYKSSEKPTIGKSKKGGDE